MDEILHLSLLFLFSQIYYLISKNNLALTDMMRSGGIALIVNTNVDLQNIKTF